MADVNSIEHDELLLSPGDDISAQLATDYAARPCLKPALDFESAMDGLDQLLLAFDQLGGDSPPAWVYVVRCEFERLQSALVPLSQAARRVAA